MLWNGNDCETHAMKMYVISFEYQFSCCEYQIQPALLYYSGVTEDR